MRNQQELIDQYHSGNMNPEEALDFEKMLESNPELNAESNFQADVVNGLKEYRKNQLKTRLNSIDVSSGWMEFAQQSTLIKSFGGVALATLIGSGVYFYAEKEEVTLLADESILVDSPADRVISFDLTFELPKKKIEKQEDYSLALPSQIKETIISEDKKLPVKVAYEEVVPEFSVPAVATSEGDQDFQSESLDKLPETKLNPDEKAIDVTTENVSSVNIRYKYYDGNLFLSGDFDKAPYEILEINKASGRKIYIQYLEKYYEVKATDKLSDLPEVKNDVLIRELKLLQANK